jgi:hypothetical protein
VKKLLVLASASALLLAGCGGATEATVELSQADPALTTPPPALAPGALGSIADVPQAHHRIGYVNEAGIHGFGGPLSVAELRRVVLGNRAAPATASGTTTVQLGSATVLQSGAAREVVGPDQALNTSLQSAVPPTSLITDETPSAVQSCLGDAVAQVLVGPSVMGRNSSVGVGLLDSGDPPAGRKLLICAAPHYFRDLDPTIARLKARFPADASSAAPQPVVAEFDVGERDIVTAKIPLGAVPAGELTELLAGGTALTALAGR